MNQLYEKALEIQKHHLKVFPMVDKRPAIKHPKEDATLNPNKAAEWWQNGKYSSIGVLLEGSGILVLDVDLNHENKVDGGKTLLAHAKGSLDTTYYETTPRGGVHFYFSYDPSLKLTEGTNLFADHDENGKVIPSGMDYNAVFVPVAPSQNKDGYYTPGKGKTWADIAPAPQWLMDEILPKPDKTFMRGFANTVRTTGINSNLLNRIVAGVDQGGRNVWTASIVGSLYRAGATPDTVISLMALINTAYIRPSLSTKELGGIIRSITLREAAR